MQSWVTFSFRQKITVHTMVTGLSLFFLLIPSSWAQGQSQERRMTVIEAVQTALIENHEIRALQSATQAQEKDIGIARSYLLPGYRSKSVIFEQQIRVIRSCPGSIRNGLNNMILIPIS